MQVYMPSTTSENDWDPGPLIVFDLGLRVVSTKNIEPTRLVGMHLSEIGESLDHPAWLPSVEKLHLAIEAALHSGRPQSVAVDATHSAPSVTLYPLWGNGERAIACQAQPQRKQGAAPKEHTTTESELLAQRRWFSRVPGSAGNRLLLETASRLEMAVEAADIGTFYVPLPMGRIYWNAQCAAHFWVPPDARVDFDLFYSRLHPDDRERARAAVNGAVYEGRAYDIEYRVLSPEGEVRWIRAKGAVRHSAQGVPTRFDGITIDISAQKRAEEERDRLLQNERLHRIEAERESRMKDTFIATASHELRTPLNAIQNWIELLERKPGDPSFVNQCVVVVKRNLLSQTRLLNDLLDASRIAAGKLEMREDRVNLADVLSAEVQALRPLADRKAVRVVAEWMPQAPILGDETRLRQIFGNILGNALKHTPAGGSISVSLTSRRGEFAIEIADTGEGIPPQFLDTIFASFAQVDGSSTRKHGGLGLGLAIARKLISLHNGRIEAFSEGLGKGATFTVALPRLEYTADQCSHDSSNDDSVADSRNDFSGLNVLLVEDDRDSLEGFRLMLMGLGVDVTSAMSAQEARTALGQRTFDAIFSDICMPEEDGYQFMQSVRTEGVTVPAFAVTALARDQDIRQAVAAGYDDHIRKPVERLAIVQMLARIRTLANPAVQVGAKPQL